MKHLTARTLALFARDPMPRRIRAGIPACGDLGAKPIRVITLTPDMSEASFALDCNQYDCPNCRVALDAILSGSEVDEVIETFYAANRVAL